MPLPLGEIVASVLHDADGDPIDSLVFSDNVRRLAVSARLENADISIGAVEIKNQNTDQRADVEDANANADFAASLNGLVVNARNAASDGTDWAILQARDANADADFVDTILGLVTNSRLALRRSASGAWTRWDGDLPLSISGTGAGSIMAAYTAAIATGLDNTGAAVLRPVEARNLDVRADVASSLIGLLVTSRISVAGLSASDLSGSAEFGLPVGIDAGTTGGLGTAGRMYLITANGRESAYVASRVGRRFYVTHQTPNTVISAQASFVATTPTFLLRQSATAVRVVLRSITITVVNTPTDDVRITVAIDTADRFSAGGTSVTPQNANEESATASGITSFLTNPTATAAGAGTRYLVNDLIDNLPASSWTVQFKDGVLLSTTASLLVYVFGNGGATAADVFFTFEWEEVA